MKFQELAALLIAAVALVVAFETLRRTPEPFDGTPGIHFIECNADGQVSIFGRTESVLICEGQLWARVDDRIPELTHNS